MKIETTKNGWRSMVTEKPDSHRRILVAYRVGKHAVGQWTICNTIYYPDTHRIFINNEAWLGDKIKYRDVHWMELPISPDGEVVSKVS